MVPLRGKRGVKERLPTAEHCRTQLYGRKVARTVPSLVGVNRAIPEPLTARNCLEARVLL